MFNENHEATLQKALTTLDERYSDPSQIMNQTVEDIIGGKEMKPHHWEGLWAFIDEVELSDAAAKAAKGKADDVWTPKKMRRAIDRRCPFLQERWITEDYRVVWEGGKVTIDHFIAFLTYQASEVKNACSRGAYPEKEQEG